jgi:D,D-heptose 1,7-bisphosphate phosphatase
MVKQVVILAGGRGTRLGTLALDRPKALVEIAGRRMIEHQIEVARRFGVERILMLTGHLGDILANWLGDGSRYGLAISYQRETTTLGTAGALKSAEHLLDEHFFVFYGDIIFDLDLSRIAAFHASHNAVATLVIHPNDHPQDSDVVEVDSRDRIIAFHRKTRPPDLLVSNLVNAGIYLMDRRCCDFIAGNTFADFGLDIFPMMVEAGETLAGYSTPEYAKDIGTLKRRSSVEADIEQGKVARRNIANAQWAVFLDRDGVLIEERGDAVRSADVKLLPGVAEAVAELNHTDYLTLVVTNQPGVAKGFLTEADVTNTHRQIDMTLGASHAYLNGYYVCPHHQQRGFFGERPDLKIDCDCRKPKPGLLLQAADRLNIHLERSFMIGDRTVDIAAGIAAGTCTIGVRTGFGCRDSILPVEPNFMCDNLLAAVRLIIECSPFIDAAKNVAAGIPPIGANSLAEIDPNVFAQLVRWQSQLQPQPARSTTQERRPG